MENKEISVQERAEQIVKQFTEAPSMQTTGYFAVNDNNKRNLLKATNMTFDTAMAKIFRIHQREISKTPGLYDAIVDLVEKAMQPNESEYVLSERFPRL